jgi:hypothetical protein
MSAPSKSSSRFKMKVEISTVLGFRSCKIAAKYQVECAGIETQTNNAETI